MQSLAQKKARENFKKAIEYRKKTGCTLKQAFAHIKVKSTVVKKKATPKKVSGYVKTIKKGGKTEVLYTNNKNAAKVKKYSKALKLVPGSAKQKSLFDVKKKSAKKPSEKSILSKIHKVKKDVDNLDEAQHKHIIGLVQKSKNDILDEIKYNNDKIIRHEKGIKLLYPYRKHKELAKSILVSKKIISELKTHIQQLKKFI